MEVDAMKKFFSLLTSAALSASMLLSLNVNADERYSPTFYFSVTSTEEFQSYSDDTVIISQKALENGDLTLKMSVRIDDESQKVDWASAKFRSESEYISLENLVDPTASTGTLKTYMTSGGEVFSTYYTPFCYAEITDDRDIKFSGTLDSGFNEEIQQMYFSYHSSLGLTSVPFSFLGDSSDEYPFAEFDAVISQDTPVGEYKIVFATRDNTEPDASGQYSSVTSFFHIKNSNLDFYNVDNPKTRDITIIINDDDAPEPTTSPDITVPSNTDSYKLGDVNFDGSIDAMDASLVLTAYANTATGNDSGFSDVQKFAADVNTDNAIDAMDASLILSYYAYTATGGKNTLIDFLSE
jgi:hypothetical protein